MDKKLKWAGSPKEEFVFKGVPPLSDVKKQYASVEGSNIKDDEKEGKKDGKK